MSREDTTEPPAEEIGSTKFADIGDEVFEFILFFSLGMGKAMAFAILSLIIEYYHIRPSPDSSWYVSLPLLLLLAFGVIGYGAAVSMVHVLCSAVRAARWLRRGGTARQIPIAAAVLIAGRRRSWSAEEWASFINESTSPTRDALGILWSAIVMRCYDAGGLLVCVARSVLKSEIRTWGLLVPIIVAALHDVVISQGWGSAFLAVPTVMGFHAGVSWVRKRWSIEIGDERRRR